MSGFLLDTCAISHGRKPQYYPRLATWLATVAPEQTFLSTATIAEVRYGIARHKDETQRSALGEWFLDIIRAFEGRILALDLDTAMSWGNLRHALESGGAPYSPVDAIIAATAIQHKLAIVTRNVRHFECSGVAILSPW